jgi:hypothetical protein
MNMPDDLSMVIATLPHERQKHERFRYWLHSQGLACRTRGCMKIGPHRICRF